MTSVPRLAIEMAVARVLSIQALQRSGLPASSAMRRAASEGQIVLPVPRFANNSRITSSISLTHSADILTTEFSGGIVLIEVQGNICHPSNGTWRIRSAATKHRVGWSGDRLSLQPRPFCGGDHSRNTAPALPRRLGERDWRRIRACRRRRMWRTVRHRPDFPFCSGQSLSRL